MYKGIIEKLLAFPQRGQIRIHFDLKNRVFRLSVPISSSRTLSEPVKKYVIAREKLTFKPHATSYQIRGKKVFLIQEIPFGLGVQDTTRKDVEQFWDLSRHCHKMLAEMEMEHAYQGALHI
ncbi:MAG: hypothetical protein KGR16_00475 [Verrucomicrobia bacterium]|nr:hypothetical protein [Verrucomicrobiota bacterium]MDE3046834.1 hypothetical protein [Verrucomicrobiota bacterium]